MEDSYIVHRRRKAAARRREKTPDPSSRNQLVESSEDEEDTRRARMEKMADEAEQQEMENKMKLEVPIGDVEMKGETKRKESPKKEIKATLAEDTSRRMSGHEDGVGNGSRTRESDTGEDTGRSVKKEMSQTEGGSSTKEASKREDPVKEKPQESLIKPKETVVASRPEAKREKRVKKKSKERLERHSRSTDSSDAEEYEKSRHPRRTKSPEEGKIRAKKSSAKRSSIVDSDGTKKTDSEKGTREKRSSSRHKLEDSEDQSKDRSEKRQSRRHSQPNTDEDPKMRKSESFPIYSSEGVAMKRSSTEVKKQIIPLSNDSLIQDFAKAQREYLRREQSILDPDPPEVFEDAQEQTALRRRKISVKHSETEKSEILESIDRSKDLDKRSWFPWLSYFRRKEEKQPPQEVTEKHKNEETKLVELDHVSTGKVTLMDFLRALKDVVAEFKAFVAQNPRETRIIIRLRNHCISELILMIIYCGLGAFVFRFTEGAFETFYKCGVKRVKRDFLDSLWNYSHNMREEDWKSMARRKLMEFEEQLHTAHEAGVHSYSGQRSWSFLNSVIYCLTVITTIGYGHISPSTTTGRAITIVYAIFGIPMFLIILADFGKLFTRGIKFLWAFVRRLYYTGSCRSVRRTVPVQEVMKGVQLVYDFATFRRPSQINPEDIEEMQKQAQQSQTVLNLDGNVPDTPGTPAMSAFAIDDEFNLPISVAIFILLGYIFVGATLYYISEDWGFFESFYFVFISMSTIGFGDFVPKQPTYMVCSIVYLVFGLALTSMCINVVQVMLSDSFRQASQKIGATIGFEIAEEDRSVNPAAPPPIEVADVHASIKESESVEKIAPKAKQEDIDL